MLTYPPVDQTETNWLFEATGVSPVAMFTDVRDLSQEYHIAEILKTGAALLCRLEKHRHSGARDVGYGLPTTMVNPNLVGGQHPMIINRLLLKVMVTLAVSALNS